MLRSVRSKVSFIMILVLAIGSTVHLRSINHGYFSYMKPSFTNFSSMESQSSTTLTEEVNANTGKVFDGVTVRTFTQPRIRDMSPAQLSSYFFPQLGPTCVQWAVVTTIFRATDAVKAMAQQPDWCLVIVADTKTPIDYIEDLTTANNDGDDSLNERVYFLSVAEQQSSKGLGNHPFVRAIPYRSFARKNIGYLFAIRHGAQALFDFDDDNELLIPPTTITFTPGTATANKNSTNIPYASPRLASPFTVRSGNAKLGQSMMLRTLPGFLPSHIAPAFNPLPLMRPSRYENQSTSSQALVTEIWPRGFPLELVKDISTTGLHQEIRHSEIPFSSIAVIQAVCNDDPDLDAVYRLTRPLPITFENNPTTRTALMAPENAYVSYNAQATVHMYDAFWALFLPFTVPGRVTDIWRAYFSQRLFRDLGLAVVYTPPLVRHARSAHNYVADMQAESNLYLKTRALLIFLDSWNDDDSKTVPDRVENLFIQLYERDYIGLEDVLAMQKWLLALQAVGYSFPNLPLHPKSPQPPASEELPLLHQQPYTLGKKYNFGDGGMTYREYRTMHSDTTDFQKWLNGREKFEIHRPQNTIVKAIVMMRDEWPISKQWILYHGEMLGFSNLYILDGSSDPRCIAFLRFARDHLGINVIYTPANLNELAEEMSRLAKSLDASSDFIVKMDVDEFLMLHNGNSDCLRANNKKHNESSIDCSLSPYPVMEYLDNHEANLGAYPYVKRLQLGYTSPSIYDGELCRSPDPDNNIGRIHFQEMVQNSKWGGVAVIKGLVDSRLIDSIDLGGHGGRRQPPFVESPGKVQLVPLSLAHLHNRCMHHEIENCRKAMISHGFILETDSNEEQLRKLMAMGANSKDPCEVRKVRPVASYHKVVPYITFLGNCPRWREDVFYPPPSTGKTNPDFEMFLADVLSKYKV